MATRPTSGPRVAPGRLVVLLRPDGDEARLDHALRCLARLVPGARVVVAPSAPPEDPEATVVSVGVGELADGPLVAASALLEQRVAAARARRAGR